MSDKRLLDKVNQNLKKRGKEEIPKLDCDQCFAEGILKMPKLIHDFYIWAFSFVPSTTIATFHLYESASQADAAHMKGANGGTFVSELFPDANHHIVPLCESIMM